ncbi:Protein SRG1 [Morus notabilis]|uniref:Protein SRG1 n=1 Tax=Morus notabilis TaxID=981085 RepID=W9QY27_9ROSA|nr:protein SRG1 [Morus notabilis]EXB58295.1 Protein SRG1 [Morus notabilis]
MAEATSIAKLGGSLAVPSVQELAKETTTLKAVPERYVRRDQDPTFIPNITSLPQVPVIDMNNLLSLEKDVLQSELQKLHLASKEWGFFQLINHGVSSLVVEGVKTGIKELFNLPMEEKKKFWQQPGDMEGFGQAFVVSDDQKLDWADTFHLFTLPKHFRKPHLLAKFHPQFRYSIETYSAELEKIANTILDLMAKALKMEPHEMRELFDNGGQTLRMNYYPPCPQADLVIGLNPHSDATGLTILLQINETEGLQIRKDGMWIPVKPLPNAFIVNVGDILEILTNGIYRSIEHRATVNIGKERLSLATFYNPKIDGEVGPAPSLITPQTPPLFRRIGVADYFKGYFSRELSGKSYVDVMRINNDENKV